MSKDIINFEGLLDQYGWSIAIGNIVCKDKYHFKSVANLEGGNYLFKLVNIKTDKSYLVNFSHFADNEFKINSFMQYDKQNNKILKLLAQNGIFREFLDKK